LLNGPLRSARDLFGWAVHPDQQSAARFLRAFESLNEVGKRAPSPQVEVAHAKVGMAGILQRIAERGKQGLIDVVENVRHARDPGMVKFWQKRKLRIE